MLIFLAKCSISRVFKACQKILDWIAALLNQTNLLWICLRHMGEGGCDKGNKVILPALPFVSLPWLKWPCCSCPRKCISVWWIFFTIALRLQQIQSVWLCRGFMDHLKPYDCITSYLSPRLTHLNSSSDKKLTLKQIRLMGAVQSQNFTLLQSFMFIFKLVSKLQDVARLCQKNWQCKAHKVCNNSPFT